MIIKSFTCAFDTDREIDFPRDSPFFDKMDNPIDKCNQILWGPRLSNKTAATGNSFYSMSNIESTMQYGTGSFLLLSFPPKQEKGGGE